MITDKNIIYFGNILLVYSRILPKISLALE
jgi:hypothetical protein